MDRRILLVEDDDFKSRKIRLLLTCELSLPNVITAGSVVAAVQAIDEGNLDLVLLDLAIPSYDEGTDGAQGLGGLTVFRYLHEVQPDVRVLVITQFETLKEGTNLLDIPSIRTKLHAEFHEQFVGLIQYRPSANDWKEAISNFIKGWRSHESTSA